MLKHCSKCGEEKPFTSEFFHRDRTQPSGLEYRCKVCRTAAMRMYRNLPTSKEKRRAYREATKEHQRARTRAYNEANREHLRQVDKVWYEANKERVRASERKRRYGISIEEWDAFYRAQGGSCALCSIDLNSLPPRAVHVDHCHTTNKIRGILCSDCNTSLGKLGDTPESIMRAYQYLTGNLRPWCEPESECAQ